MTPPVWTTHRRLTRTAWTWGRWEIYRDPMAAVAQDEFSLRRNGRLVATFRRLTDAKFFAAATEGKAKGEA
jgi:hypothetical protein